MAKKKVAKKTVKKVAPKKDAWPPAEKVEVKRVEPPKNDAPPARTEERFEGPKGLAAFQRSWDGHTVDRKFVTRKGRVRTGMSKVDTTAGVAILAKYGLQDQAANDAIKTM